VEQLVTLFNNLPGQLKPLVVSLFTLMCAIAGLMIMTAGRNGGQVAGGLLTIRNAVFGGIIFVIAATVLLSVLRGAGVGI
jgi:hypothetical protein